MIEKELISVIVPVYNTANYLDKCIESIVSQTYSNLQIIIVDDGSLDNAGEIADSWKERDSRITVIHQNNAGLSAARNSGIDIAQGDWCFFFDSDDWAELGMIEEFVLMSRKYDADIIQFGGYYRDFKTKSIPNGKMSDECMLTPNEALDSYIKEGVVNHVVWTKMWRTDLCRKVRFIEGYTAEDCRFGWRALLECKKGVAVTPKRFYHYVQNPNSIMHKVNMRSFADQWIARKELFDIFSGGVLNGEKRFLKVVRQE